MSEAQTRKVAVWLNDGSEKGRFIKKIPQAEADCLVQHRQAAGVKNYKGQWKSIVLAPDANLMPRLAYRLGESTTFAERLECGRSLIQHRPVPSRPDLTFEKAA